MKYENEMFQDLMGIVIDTEDKWLDKKLNGHICYKGGGGGGTTTSTPLMPEEFKPFAKQYANKLVRAGQSDNVFGQIANQDSALRQAQEAALGRTGEVRRLGQAGVQAQQEAMTGRGLFGAQNLESQKDALAMQAADRLGQQTENLGGEASARGVAGGRRAQFGAERAKALAGAQLTGKLAELDTQDLAARRSASANARGETAAMQKAGMADIDLLRGVGKERTAFAQKQADKAYTALQQQAGLFSGVPQGTSQTSSGGGGK
jgi:hypothetical protein